MFQMLLVQFVPQRLKSLFSTQLLFIAFACPLVAFFLNTSIFAQAEQLEDKQQALPNSPAEPTDMPGAENDALLDKVDKESGLHDWHRFVRGFRKGHHFGLTVGASRPEWDLSEFTGLSKHRDTGFIAKLRYS